MKVGYSVHSQKLSFYDSILRKIKDVLVSLGEENNEITQFLNYDDNEPFPKLNQDNISNILSCVERGLYFGDFDNEYLRYSNIYYNLIKGHILINGNKRLATLALVIIMYALYLDQHTIEELEQNHIEILENIDISKLSIEVAKSDRTLKEDTLKEISEVVFKNLRHI